METSAEPDKQQTEEKETTAEAVVSETKADATPAAAEEKPADESKSQGKGKKRRAKSRKNKKSRSSKQVAERFAACGRCSFFWTGYRVVMGESAQETAVENSDAGWLDLEWNAQMPDLVYKSYGVRLDIDFYHYEGCCKECRRRFVYQGADGEDENGRFAIEISPHEAN